MKQLIRDIKRITRRKFTADEKTRIVLEGFRRDTPIRHLCRREGIRPGSYYAWLGVAPGLVLLYESVNMKKPSKGDNELRIRPLLFLAK